MPNLEIVEPPEASTEVRDLYVDFQRRMGFPAAPNFIKVQGHSIAAARGSWGLVQNTLLGGSLPRTLKEWCSPRFPLIAIAAIAKRRTSRAVACSGSTKRRSPSYRPTSKVSIH
jgi:hypothetical protein